MVHICALILDGAKYQLLYSPIFLDVFFCLNMLIAVNCVAFYGGSRKVGE